MKKNRKPEKPSEEDTIKLRLDHRTVIYVKSKESLKNWLARYPEAKVIL